MENYEINPQRILEMLMSAEEEMFLLGVNIAVGLGFEWLNENVPFGRGYLYDNKGMTTNYTPKNRERQIAFVSTRNSIVIYIYNSKLSWCYLYQTGHLKLNNRFEIRIL